MEVANQFIFDSVSNEKNLVLTQCSLSEEPEVVVAIMGEDIPEDFDYLHVIKFVGNVPPPPHSVQQHEQMALLEREFKRFMTRKR